MQKKVYIVGIEGAGTSALARIYAERGFDVLGSDDGDGFYRAGLEHMEITTYTKFDAENIPFELDFAVYSTAFDERNVEVAELKKRAVPTYTYPEAVGALTQEMYTIAVCGTHGKTTTSGFVAHAFLGAGRDVSAIIGAPVNGWESGARVGSGEEFILEADEYQNKLALYNPQSVILTSVDYDHPDFFPDFDTYKKAFKDFVVRIPRIGFLVANADDHDVVEIVETATCNVVTYGMTEKADAQITDIRIMDIGQEIHFTFQEEKHMLFTELYGAHNAHNALAAWLMSFSVTGDAEGSEKGVLEYKGVKRRFEKKGFYNDTILIDDYAHHPEEVRTTLATAKEVFPEKNIVAAFHPHTYSRTEALLEEFARALDVADHVVVLDIYSSAREMRGDVSAMDLVDAVNQGISDKAEHVPTIDELAVWCEKNLTENDVFVTLGAGDVYKVHDKLLDV